MNCKIVIDKIEKKLLHSLLITSIKCFVLIVTTTDNVPLTMRGGRSG